MDKNAIKKYAVWARNELIARVSQKAQQYGITAEGYGDKNADSVNGVLLSATEKKQRQALAAKIDAEGFEQVMEEVAYTWFNRFTALRFMEVNNYLPSHTRVFTNEANEFKPQILADAISLELEGLDMDKVYALKDDNKDEELYKYLLIVQCNALSSILPGMFQKIADYTELLLPDYLLREGSVIEQMITVIPEDNWTDQIQIIGWLYQYYNTEQNELVYDGSLSKAKVSKELLPAATTIYTPDWPVRYMVENSLGRLWGEAHPQSQLLSEWRYYLTNSEISTISDGGAIKNSFANINPEEILCIDPCSGSGHILGYLFDTLVKIYEDHGFTAKDAAVSIVNNNLWGLDIDERASQLAYFSVMMKARHYGGRKFFSNDLHPHIYSIKESNDISDATINYFCQNDVELKKAISSIVAELKDAKEYGSILNISQKDYTKIYRRLAEIEHDIDLFSYSVMSELLPVIQVAEALSKTYHVVCTNPPYLGNSRFSVKLDKYIKKNYLEEKSDLSMVMFKRALTGFVKKNGFVAFITTNSWLVLSRFEKLREYVLENYSFDSLVDFGTELFEGKVGHNPIVAWVSRATKKTGKFVAIRLVDYCYGRRDEKETEYFNRQNYYYPDQNSFSYIPGFPITYSFSKEIIEAFENSPSLSDKATTRLGMTTADNNKFLRLWYEVDSRKLILDAESDEQVQLLKKKWVPYNKGGKYRKWYGNHDCVVNWENSGYEIKNFADDKGHIRSTVPNTEYYFLPCATWSKISSGSIAFRFRPKGSIFDVAGACLYANEGIYELMGFLNSNVADRILSVLSPTLNYEGSHIASLPIVNGVIGNSRIRECVLENIELSKQDWDAFEFSWDFKMHPFAKKGKIKDHFENWAEECEYRFSKLKSNEEEINRILISLYGVSETVDYVVEDRYVTVNRADVSRDVKSFMSYAVGCMFGRYSIENSGVINAGEEIDYTKYGIFKPDSDNIIPICEDEYFEDDIVARFVEFVKIVCGEEFLEENLIYIGKALGGKGTAREVIRHYFLNDFYADHCANYAFGTSGKRPIYWLFDSGKKNGFKCLIYMHRYQPDTIARIRTDYVHEQQSRYRTALADLEQRINSASTSERVKLNKQLKTIQDQAEELRKYEEKVHHLADQMISIDLDDGVKENYAKFQDVLAKIK